MIYDLSFHVWLGGSETVVEWPKDATVTSLGPGVLAVKKTVHKCPNFTTVLQVDHYENHVDDMVLSTWSTVTHIFMLPDKVPDPQMEWWGGKQEFVVVLDDHKGVMSGVQGVWSGGLIKVVKNADGTYATWKVPKQG